MAYAVDGHGQDERFGYAEGTRTGDHQHGHEAQHTDARAPLQGEPDQRNESGQDDQGNKDLRNAVAQRKLLNARIEGRDGALDHAVDQRGHAAGWDVERGALAQQPAPGPDQLSAAQVYGAALARDVAEVEGGIRLENAVGRHHLALHHDKWHAGSCVFDRPVAVIRRVDFLGQTVTQGMYAAAYLLIESCFYSGAGVQQHDKETDHIKVKPRKGALCQRGERVDNRHAG